MKRIQKVMSKVSGSALLKAAAFLVFLGGLGANLCMFPYWHNEPTLPRSMREE